MLYSLLSTIKSILAHDHRRLPVEFAAGDDVHEAEEGLLAPVLEGLPYELTAQILSLTDPGTLLSLARTTKALRASLLCTSSLHIWVAARHHSGMTWDWQAPSRKEMNEADFAVLVWTDECTICARATGAKAEAGESWHRWCKECRDSHVMVKWEPWVVEHSPWRARARELIHQWRIKSLAEKATSSFDLPLVSDHDLIARLSTPEFLPFVASYPFIKTDWDQVSGQLYKLLRVYFGGHSKRRPSLPTLDPAEALDRSLSWASSAV